MKILSLETTTELAGIAWIEDGVLVREESWRSRDIASELMERLQSWPVGGCPVRPDRIVISLGPGSWTGTRVGISLAKGLAAGDREKLYGIYGPESFRFQLRESRERIICLINAYQGKYYYAGWVGGAVRVTDLMPIRRGTLDEILAGIRRRTLLVGPAVPVAVPGAAAQALAIPAGPGWWYPRAGVNGLLAYERIKRGMPSPPVEPYYGK